MPKCTQTSDLDHEICLRDAQSQSRTEVTSARASLRYSCCFDRRCGDHDGGDATGACNCYIRISLHKV